MSRLGLLLDSIKFAHSIFALPFALVAMIVAAGGWPEWRVAGLVVMCMVAARSAAMTFNRLADRRFDAENPRAKSRPSVTGALSPGFMIGFMLACCAVFVAGAYLLNTVCFALSLPVLAILLGYSLSKRFTALCHFWLGLALGLAPVAAHLAVRGDLTALPALGGRWGAAIEWFPILLGATVLTWVSGFDLIYACQDYEIDARDPRLHSTPKAIGIRAALILSAFLHILSFGLLLFTGYYAGMGMWYYLACGMIGLLLAYEHWIVRPDDLSRVNVAFFTINGAVSLLLFVAVLLERVIFPR